MRVVLVGLVMSAAGACAYQRPAVDLDAGDGDALVVDAAIDAATDAPDGATSCITDDQCASLVCEAGACVPEDQVRYADAIGGSAIASCTRTAPCITITQARAAAPDPQVAYVVVGPGTYAAPVRLLSGALTLVGASALGRPIISDTGGPAIDVRGGVATLRRLQVTSTAPSGGDGVRCDSATVSAEDVIARGATGDGIDSRDCELALDRAQLVSNGGSGLQFTGTGSLVVLSSIVHGNPFGGAAVSTTGACAVTGTIVDNNGQVGSAVGGLQLTCATGVTVENVSFARNLAGDGTAGKDLACTTAAGAGSVRNAIFSSATPQLGGCAPTYSLFEGLTTAPTGVGNRVATSAGFVDPTSGNFHILVSSPARESGDPATPSARDVDGESRPLGRWDIGADEIP